jgi:uncharacterized protein
MIKPKRKLNHEEFSSRGGKTTLAKYGPDHFSDIGKKGAKSKLKKFGVDYYDRLSKAGVAARKAKQTKRLLEENKE